MWNELELTLPKPPSLNKIYESKHWSIRKKYKDEYTKICKAELESTTLALSRIMRFTFGIIVGMMWTILLWLVSFFLILSRLLGWLLTTVINTIQGFALK